jgi:hypothetical protein
MENNTTLNQVSVTLKQVIDLYINVKVKKMMIRMLMAAIGDSYHDTPECVEERKEIKLMMNTVEVLMKELNEEDYKDACEIMKMHDDVFYNRMNLLSI